MAEFLWKKKLTVKMWQLWGPTADKLEIVKIRYCITKNPACAVLNAKNDTFLVHPLQPKI